MIIKATKKPVTIEAIQFVITHQVECKHGTVNEHNGMEIARFIGKPVRFPTIPDGTKQGKIVAIIETLEGDMQANIGDYIIKGVKGEFYPCKPDIFKETYNYRCKCGEDISFHSVGCIYCKN